VNRYIRLYEVGSRNEYWKEITINGSPLWNVTEIILTVPGESRSSSQKGGSSIMMDFCLTRKKPVRAVK